MNTWFATAGDASDWFRKRRLAKFMPNGEIDMQNCLNENSKIPSLIIRKYNYQYQDNKKPIISTLSQSDFEFHDEIVI